MLLELNSFLPSFNGFSFLVLPLLLNVFLNITSFFEIFFLNLEIFFFLVCYPFRNFAISLSWISLCFFKFRNQLLDVPFFFCFIHFIPKFLSSFYMTVPLSNRIFNLFNIHPFSNIGSFNFIFEIGKKSITLIHLLLWSLANVSKFIWTFVEGIWQRFHELLSSYSWLFHIFDFLCIHISFLPLHQPLKLHDIFWVPFFRAFISFLK